MVKKMAPKKSVPEVATEVVEKIVEAIETIEEATPEVVEELEEQPMEEALAEEVPDEKEVIYAEIECLVLIQEDGGLSCDVAKQYLGWTEPEGEEEFDDPDVVMFGKTVVLNNIQGVQRAINPGLYERYAMEILHGNWAGMREDETPNGETIIIGRFGRVLDGDHRLLGLIRAVELWTEAPDKYPYWEDKGEPFLTTVILLGISEDPRVLNTLNTGKPRNLADAIHTSGLFKDFSKRDMKKVCKAADFAIKTVWDHTGTLHAYGPRKSHAEALDFVLRHPRLIDAVKSCFAEEPKLSETGLSTGAMAALMYLMGTSKTVTSNKKGTGYAQVDDPSEKQIDFSLWSKAEEFMIAFAQGDAKLKTLYNSILNLTDNEDGKNFGIFRTVDRNILYEKSCLVFKAWHCWLKGDPITIKTIGLKYRTDEEGEKFLSEEYTVGGIDLGINRKEEAEANDE